MSSHTKKLTPSSTPNIALTKLKQIIFRKVRGFQTPFSERRALLLVTDSLLIILATYGAFLLWQYSQQQVDPNAAPITILDRWYWVPTLLLGWWGGAWLNDLYHIPSSTQRFTTFTRLALISGMALLFYSIIFFLAPRDALPRLFFLYFLGLGLPAVFIWRLAYSTVFTMLPLQHRVLIVGLGNQAQFIARTLRENPKLNYEPLGYVPSQQTDENEIIISPDELPIVGSLLDLPRLAQRMRAQQVVVATDHPMDGRLFELLMRCQSWGMGVVTMPNLYEKLTRSIPIQHIDPTWTLQILQDLPVFSRLQLAIKRFFDLVVSSLSLIFTAPLMLIIALAILIEDRKGSIFYKQTRVGRGGRLFDIYKFRTMVTEAEKDGQARWAAKNDPRITRVGRILRKTRLDELPQLINIFNGHMSLAGPRPERPEFIKMLEEHVPFYRTRLLVKPGLTGWAQVHGDYTSDVEGAVNKLEYDLYYLRYWSFWLDIYIIFKTVGVMLKMKGI